MTTVYDVPPDLLIEKVTAHLKSQYKLTPPKWVNDVRTGIHTEKEPIRDDWWFIRTAAVLRKIYINGPIGSDRLSEMFGGTRDRGSKPSKAAKGSGSVIRSILKELDKAGLTEMIEKKGRKLTTEGISVCDNNAKKVMEKLAIENPELTKY